MTAVNGSSIPAPFSQEAEEAVIGAILIDPAALLDLDFLRPDDFFILRHRMTFAAIQQIQARNEPIDFLTVQEQLKASRSLQDVGGPAWLLNLVNNTPTSIHAEVYGRLVQRAALRRRMMETARELTVLAQDEGLALEQVMNAAQSAVFSMLDAGADGRHEHHIGDMVDRLLARIEAQIENPDNRPSLPLGFRDLDEIFDGGLWRDDLTVVAARPAMGKTAFLLNAALNMARVGARVGITSLEMNEDALMMRLASAETGINLRRLRRGNVNQTEWARLLAAGEQLSGLPLFTNDAPAQTVEQVHACIRRWQMKHGIDVAIIDYLGLLHSADSARGRDENRTREIDRMMVGLKNLARDIHIPVVVAAQVNRAVELRQDKRPMLADLRDSGGIEASADNVVFIYRDVVYDEHTEHPNRAEFIVGKQRNGTTGSVVLHYERTLTKFLDARVDRIDLSKL